MKHHKVLAKKYKPNPTICSHFFKLYEICYDFLAFLYPIPMFLKSVLLLCDVKLFHDKSTCCYSLSSELLPHPKNNYIFIGSDTDFVTGFPELTTQLVAVNKRLQGSILGIFGYHFIRANF